MHAYLTFLYHGRGNEVYTCTELISRHKTLANGTLTKRLEGETTGHEMEYLGTSQNYKQPVVTEHMNTNNIKNTHNQMPVHCSR